MPLPADVARCPGAEWPECEECQRRTDRNHFVGVNQMVWMEPPPVIAFWCEYLIEKEEQ